MNSQIADLKNQILEQEAILAQKEAANQHLKKDTSDLQESLPEILSELKAIEQTQQIQELVERLRTEPPASDPFP